MSGLARRPPRIGWVALLLLAGCSAEPRATVAAGLAHSCDLRAGEVRCWGNDTFGQLGLDGARAEHVSAGGDTTCVVHEGTVRCVGGNHRGQLGDGTLMPRGAPVDVMEDAVAVSVGFAHVCALDTAQHVWCWGWNGNGQSGAGEEDVLTPQRVEGPPADRVVAGYDTSCAIRGTRLRCWGRLTLDETNVRDVALGVDHACALTADALTCWGAPPGGGLPPLETPLVLPFSGGSIAAGAIDHLCVTDAAGEAYCLGKNTFGQLGRGDFLAPDVPSPVFELGGPVQALAVGGEHTCARVGEETWCWGWNADGQLGKDPGLDSVVPVRVP